MKRATIIEAIIFLYSVLFLYTGISKIIAYDTFREQLIESPIVSPISSLISVIVPLIEFLIVLMLILPRWRLKGLYAAMTLMIAFTIYVIMLISISTKLPCSCGGIISMLSWQQHILVNTVFIGLALGAIRLQKKEIRMGQKDLASVIRNDQSIISSI